MPGPAPGCAHLPGNATLSSTQHTTQNHTTPLPARVITVPSRVVMTVDGVHVAPAHPQVHNPRTGPHAHACHLRARTHYCAQRTTHARPRAPHANVAPPRAQHKPYIHVHTTLQAYVRAMPPCRCTPHSRKSKRRATLLTPPHIHNHARPRAFSPDLSRPISTGAALD